MRIGASASGYDATVTTSPVTDGTTTNNNGANVDKAITETANFWLNTMHFNSAIWDTTGVETRGYPLLYGVGGQE